MNKPVLHVALVFFNILEKLSHGVRCTYTGTDDCDVYITKGMMYASDVFISDNKSPIVNEQPVKDAILAQPRLTIKAEVQEIPIKRYRSTDTYNNSKE